jgi:signal transduction histidine kinase
LPVPVTERTWQLAIIASALAAVLLTIYCLSNGINTVFMHTYYLPIILLALHYHRQGIILSAWLALVYLTLVVVYLPGNGAEITGAAIRVVVFVFVAVVVGYLSFVLEKERKKTEALNDEANLYLDILTHDINNVNTAALGYAELLTELPDAHEKSLARKLYGTIRQSIEILGNVATLRKIREEPAALAAVDLDTIIRHEIAHFPDARIRYDGRKTMVIADSLLGEVLTNLIGNSYKFGGPGVEIGIRVEEKEGMVEVSVEDTGPGIQDEIKPVIFNRFRKGTGRKSGKGLGLFITRMLIGRYGGRIRADDRVPGDPGKGAAIRFTLRKGN